MIGEEIRRQRQDLGLTGAQLAARAGMAPSAVSQIETGKRTPSSASVVKLAEGLGVEVGDLYPKKAQAPLPLDAPAGGAGSLELSLTDVIADLRRTTYRHVGFQEVQQALDEYCGVWEKRLAEGDFDKAAIEESGRTIKFFWPAVTAAADSEMVDGMRFGTYEEAVANSKLLPAIERFQALCESVNSAYRKEFQDNVYPFPQREAS